MLQMTGLGRNSKMLDMAEAETDFQIIEKRSSSPKWKQYYLFLLVYRCVSEV